MADYVYYWNWFSLILQYILQTFANINTNRCRNMFYTHSFYTYDYIQKEIVYLCYFTRHEIF